MDKPTKRALLYSALVGPGTGHWLLGQRGKGVVLMGAFLGLTVLFCYRLFTMMVSFYDEMMDTFATTGEVFPDVTAIQEIHSSIYIENWWLILGVLALWAYGVWDIYPSARKRGSSATGTGGAK